MFLRGQNTIRGQIICVAWIIVRAIFRAAVNRKPSIGIGLSPRSNLFFRKMLIPPIGTIDLEIGRRDIDEPLWRKARGIARHTQRLAILALRLWHRHAQWQSDIDVQFPSDAVILVKHHALPTATRLNIEPFRHLVGFLHQLGVIDIDARLPSEALGHNVLPIAIVITELGIVRTAEWQPRFQLPLLLIILSAVDALLQLFQSWRLSQRVVVLERAFRNECPCMLLGLT